MEQKELTPFSTLALLRKLESAEVKESKNWMGDRFMEISGKLLSQKHDVLVRLNFGKEKSLTSILTNEGLTRVSVNIEMDGTTVFWKSELAGDEMSEISTWLIMRTSAERNKKHEMAFQTLQTALKSIDEL
jgi:hypothetical protein